MTNVNGNQTSPAPILPLNQNINIIAFMGALMALLIDFGMRSKTAQDLVTLIAIATPVAIAVTHTLWNHPQNLQRLRDALMPIIGTSYVRRLVPMFALLLVLPFVLGGCSSTGGGIVGAPALQDSIKQIGAFTIADLQNADAIALAQNPPDLMADACYKGITVFVQQEQSAAGGLASNTVSGAFSAFEQARAGLNAANGAISRAQIQALETACGPLQIDVQNNAAAFLAGVAALGKL